MSVLFLHHFQAKINFIVLLPSLLSSTQAADVPELTAPKPHYTHAGAVAIPLVREVGDRQCGAVKSHGA